MDLCKQLVSALEPQPEDAELIQAAALARAGRTSEAVRPLSFFPLLTAEQRTNERANGRRERESEQRSGRGRRIGLKNSLWVFGWETGTYGMAWHGVAWQSVPARGHVAIGRGEANDAEAVSRVFI